METRFHSETPFLIIFHIKWLEKLGLLDKKRKLTLNLMSGSLQSGFLLMELQALQFHFIYYIQDLFY